MSEPITNTETPAIAQESCIKKQNDKLKIDYCNARKNYRTPLLITHSLQKPSVRPSVKNLKIAQPMTKCTPNAIQMDNARGIVPETTTIYPIPKMLSLSQTDNCDCPK